MESKEGNPRETISRREGLKLGAAGMMGSLLPVSALAATPSRSSRSESNKENAMADNPAIRPFHFEAPKAELIDLRKRIEATRWPEKETVADDTQGVQLATMQKLAHYWATEHNWRKCETRLMALPHFVTEIDGLDIHFIHVRSKHKNALPVIITHGWPGSVIEQLKIVEPLTNPTAYGGSEADAFDVVIPSLPGYGSSARPTAPGWNPVSIARAWATLMQRLGYTRYAAQGGDWGNAVSEVMALQQPPGLLGIHTNMPATVPPNISKALAFHEAPPADLSAEEKHAWDQLDFFYAKGLGYANEMANRPQTLYGIVDSPVGLASWILDHDIRSYELIARVFDGQREGLTRDDILDNITLYWLTNTAISSTRLYWDTAQLPAKGGFFDARGVKIPVAVSSFPMRSIRRRRVGRRRHIPGSFTTTSFPKVAISRPGSSRCFSSPNFVPRSNRFAGRRDRRSQASLLRTSLTLRQAQGEALFLALSVFWPSS